MMQGRVGAVRPGRGKTKTRVSIWDLLQWAFQRELAGIDFDEIATLTHQSVIGGSFLMMQHGLLGCRVDGGGRSPSHPDADIVASALSCLPEAHGGRRMALTIADLARTGRVPDWMEGAAPRVVPAQWRDSKYGRFAKTEVVGKAQWVSRGQVRETEIRVCPVTYQSPQEDILSARRFYLAWWMALLELQISMRMSRDLSAFEVTEAMPPHTPWQKNS